MLLLALRMLSDTLNRASQSITRAIYDHVDHSHENYEDKAEQKCSDAQEGKYCVRYHSVLSTQ